MVLSAFARRRDCRHFVSPEAKESQDRENDDDCSDPPNDVVHGVLLAAKWRDFERRHPFKVPRAGNWDMPPPRPHIITPLFEALAQLHLNG